MELKKYDFDFNVLDDDGKPQHQRTANDDDVSAALAGEGETSPSEVLHKLTLAEMDKHPALKYREALGRVQERNPQLVRLHASESAGRLRVY